MGSWKLSDEKKKRVHLIFKINEIDKIGFIDEIKITVDGKFFPKKHLNPRTPIPTIANSLLNYYDYIFILINLFTTHIIGSTCINV